MPSQAWEDQNRIVEKISNRYVPRLSRVLEAEYKEVLSIAREQGIDQAMRSIDTRPMIEGLSETITDIYRDAGVRMARVVYRETLRKYPERKMREEKRLGQMGISKEWLTSVQDVLNKHALTFVVDITSSVRYELIKIFEVAAAEGWGYEKIAQYILQRQFKFSKGLPEYRARRIARTEAHRGAMAGSVAGAASLPYEVQKEWISGRDKRVRGNPSGRYPDARFDHWDIHGQVVDLEQPFKNEESIKFPGDPDASKGNTINCRCVLGYIPKRDERGRVIMKT